MVKTHPKDITSLFKEPLPIHFQTDNGLESLIAGSRPLIQLTDQETSTSAPQSIIGDIEPQLIKDLPVQIMVQSSDVHNNYTVTDVVDDESSGDEQQTVKGIETTSESIIVNTPDNAPEIDEKPRLETWTDEIISTTETVKISPTTEWSTSTTTTTAAGSVPTTLVISTTTEGTGRVKKDGKDTPSLDKIVERVFKKYQSREDIPSYEEVWYDDNGELLWSQEDYLGKNVKRQVSDKPVVRPVPLTKSDAAAEEMLRLNQMTDVIDRFRTMLDIAQQVDYYLLKRFQSAVNAMAVMYGDSPPSSLGAKR